MKGKDRAVTAADLKYDVYASMIRIKTRKGRVGGAMEEEILH